MLRIIESCRLEKTFKIYKSNHQCDLMSLIIKPWPLMPFRDGNFSTSLGGIPILEHPFFEESFPNVQSKPSLMQLETISFHPVTCHLRKEINTLFAVDSSQIVVEILCLLKWKVLRKESYIPTVN